jgi:hypothetical protein
VSKLGTFRAILPFLNNGKNHKKSEVFSPKKVVVGA